MIKIEYMYANMSQAGNSIDLHNEGLPSTSDENKIKWLNYLGMDGWIIVSKPEVHDYYKGYEGLFYREVPLT